MKWHPFMAHSVHGRVQTPTNGSLPRKWNQLNYCQCYRSEDWDKNNKWLKNWGIQAHTFTSNGIGSYLRLGAHGKWELEPIMGADHVVKPWSCKPFSYWKSNQSHKIRQTNCICQVYILYYMYYNFQHLRRLVTIVFGRPINILLLLLLLLLLFQTVLHLREKEGCTKTTNASL